MLNNKAEPPSDVSLDTLQGRQSVRATFTLPRQAIALISTVASQLGVKQKSIFDHLVENQHFLDQVASEASKQEPAKRNRKQKTFVLSRNSLNALERFARSHQLPRDLVVELSIKKLEPVIDAQKQKHVNRKALLKEMNNVSDTFQHLMVKAEKLVGTEDDTYARLVHIMTLNDKCIRELSDIVDKGKCMDAFD